MYIEDGFAGETVLWINDVLIDEPVMVEKTILHCRQRLHMFAPCFAGVMLFPREVSGLQCFHYGVCSAGHHLCTMFLSLVKQSHI